MSQGHRDRSGMARPRARRESLLLPLQRRARLRTDEGQIDQKRPALQHWRE
ncbi:MAG: hypothetical protein ACM3US_10735 [Sphingomonadaceae bacterium]